MADQEFDVVVIGSGPAGYVCAIRCAQLGLKTACVEKNPTLGGTCLNIGCIPSKALLQSSEYFERTRDHLSGHGIKVGSVELDLPAMLARKDKVVDGLTKGIAFLFKKNKIDWLKGWLLLSLICTLNDRCLCRQYSITYCAALKGKARAANAASR